MKLQLQCQICDEIIATFDSQRMALPLTGKMFQAKEEGYDYPFYPDIVWELFKCPFGNHQPFLVTDEMAAAWVEGRGLGPEILKTTKGNYNVIEQTLHARTGQTVFLGETKKIEKEQLKKEDTPPELKNEFKCGVCGKPFKSQNALNSHSKKHKPKTEKVANG
jgi:hypothetical protein